MSRGMGIQNPMFFMGVVENNVDPTLQGRVQVRAFGVHGRNDDSEIPTAALPWAVCVAGNFDPNNPVPKLNSFVFGMFIDGSEGQHPLILGLVPGQYVEEHSPENHGWGVIPAKDGDILAQGADPKSIGQPQNSRLARGEYLDETYLGPQYTNSKLDQKIAGSEDTWDEPPPAYGAKYPYNRVIETARHSIEIDDTPGAERIQITHGSGAYIQIDAIGTVTERAESDRYEINIGTKHESSGHSVVTINGNSHVYVKGNKTEEIMGNYKRIVHGENEITVGGQSYLNVGGHLFMRGASTKIEGNADRVTIFGRNEVQIEAEKQVNTVSGHIKNTAMLTFSAYANKAVRLTTPQDMHFYAVGSIINTALGTAPTSLTPVAGSTGSQTSRGFNVTAPTVNMLSASGSFSGLWNAGSVNTAALLATAGQIGALTVPGAVSANTIAAFGISTAGLSAWAYTGPVGSGAPSGTAPVAPPAFPTLPAINPPGISSPVPSLVPGQISGVAFPQGNGPGFAATVLTSPLAALTGFDINILPEGGLGIPRIQMPQPASHGASIIPGGYFSLGHAMGYISDQDERQNQTEASDFNG